MPTNPNPVSTGIPITNNGGSVKGILDLRQIPLVTFPVTVPTDFVGFTFHRWPTTGLGTLAKAPTGLNYGMARTWDADRIRWNLIETSAGVYDATALARFDSLVTAHRQNGASVLWTCYGTPQFYASDTSGTDPYAATGAYSVPTNPAGYTGLTNFVNMIITRYNTAGGTWQLANPGLGNGIQYIETWNEQAYPGAAGTFFKGAVGDAVDISYTINQAAKAVDATVKVLSPPWTGSVNRSYFQAHGTVNTGITPGSFLNGACWHAYGYDPSTILGINSPGNISGIVDSRQALTDVGLGSLPLYLTESGTPYNGTQGFNGTSWPNIDPESRRKQLLRLMLILAACGVKCICIYAYDDSLTYPCDFVTTWGVWSDQNGLWKAVNDFKKNVAGKTIVGADYTNASPVTVYFNDGTYYQV